MDELVAVARREWLFGTLASTSLRGPSNLYYMKLEMIDIKREYDLRYQDG